MGVIHQRIADLAPARQFPVRNIPPERLARGVIVREPNWLGDAVMTLPALQSLREMLPENAPLAVIAPPGVAEMLRLLPGIDHILAIPPHTSWPKEAKAAIRQLGIPNGFLFTNSLRDAWQMRRCGVRYLYGKPARFRRFLLARSFPFPAWKKGVLNESHHALEDLSMVLATGGRIPEPFMPRLVPRLRFDLLKMNFQALCQHPKLLVLAPGAAYGAAKRWSSENFRAVTEYWLKEDGMVAVVGSESEFAIGAEVLGGLPEKRAVNLCGKTRFTELYHLLASARLCVANDSGIMHLAAAIGTPGVAVFGPTDYRATGPIADNWQIVFEKAPCAPCFNRICPKKNPICMKQIPPETVIAAIKKAVDR